MLELAVVLGSYSAGGKNIEELRSYANHIGIAFQIRDDLLDYIGNWAFSILLAIAVIFLIRSAFAFMSAGGGIVEKDKPSGIKKARQMSLLPYTIVQQNEPN